MIKEEIARFRNLPLPLEEIYEVTEGDTVYLVDCVGRWITSPIQLDEVHTILDHQ